MKPLLVEFAGLPGSGKTTVARRAAAILQERGVQCVYRPPLPARAGEGAAWLRFRFLWFRMTQWRLILACFAFVTSVRPLRLSHLQALHHMLFLAFYQREQCENQHQVILLDQSITQTMWGVVSGVDRWDWNRAERLLRTFHSVASGRIGIAAFEIDPLVASDRALKRGRTGCRSRIDSLSPDALRSALTLGSKSMKVLVECSIANTGAPAAQIDGSRSREDTAVQVAEIIDRMLCAEARALEPHRGSGEEEER